MVAVARLIDPDETLGHVAAIRVQRDVVDEPEATPSARLLADLRASGLSLGEYGLDLASRTRAYFDALPAEINRNHARLAAEAVASRDRQAAIEAADRLGFDDYLAEWFAR
jgi:glutamate--cysteine ligase